MPYKFDLLNMLQDWWGFVAFALGGFAAFVVGKERQRYKVDQVGKDVEKLSQRVTKQSAEIEALKQQGNTEAVALAGIASTQQYIVKTLDEIKANLKEKADK